MPRQVIDITDETQVTHLITFPIDDHFAAFHNGIIMNEGDEYSLGPDPDEITLLFVPSVGDCLELRRM